MGGVLLLVQKQAGSGRYTIDSTILVGGQVRAYLSQVHQISDLVLIIVPVLAVVLQDEVLQNHNKIQLSAIIHENLAHHITSFNNINLYTSSANVT